MPNDFIQINRSTGDIYASDLYSLTSLVRQTIDIAEKVKDYCDHTVEGADYTALETLFGLPAGSGDEVYNLVAGTLGALKGQVQSADALTLIARVG